MAIVKEAVDLVKEAEGYIRKLPDGRCQAYLDKLASRKYWSKGYNGLWTIGWGCTVGVTEGLIWTEAQAERYLRSELEKHRVAVLKQLTVKPNENELGAIVSLSYNLGPKGFPTLIRLFNQGDKQGAGDAFLNYTRAGGRVYPGLVKRRKAERKLFFQLPTSKLPEVSKKLSFIQWLRRLVSGSALAGYFSWDSLGSLKSFVSDNVGVTLLSIALVVVAIMAILAYWSEQDYKQGRWTPSRVKKEKMK